MLIYRCDVKQTYKIETTLQGGVADTYGEASPQVGAWPTKHTRRNDFLIGHLDRSVDR
jgi:hypothetical protein